MSATTPAYSMAQSIDIRPPEAAPHDDSHPLDEGGDRLSCPHRQQRRDARDRIEAIILSAFPDLEDRSDYRSDHFDYCLSIH